MLNGADSLAAAALYSGAAGVIWGGANIAPKTAAAFVDAAMNSQWDRAQELWRPLEPLMRHLEKGEYVPSVYAAAEMAGYPAGSPRRPFAALSREKRAALQPFVDSPLAII